MSLDNPMVIPVPFHGDTITAIETPQGEFVAIKPICERFGLAWQAQHRKLAANLDRWGIINMVIPSAGGPQETTCIPVSKVFGWLATISIRRVKPELRDRLALYQDEADAVCDRHFRLRAAQKEMRIEELERMLWHAGQHLRLADRKWQRAYTLLELGQSDYLVAQRCGWSMDRWNNEKAMMRRCGLVPKWREDMGTLLDQNSDLRWQLERRAQQTDQHQMDLGLEG